MPDKETGVAAGIGLACERPRFDGPGTARRGTTIRSADVRATRMDRWMPGLVDHRCATTH
jgi:hypothetical protein